MREAVEEDARRRVGHNGVTLHLLWWRRRQRLRARGQYGCREGIGTRGGGSRGLRGGAWAMRTLAQAGRVRHPLVFPREPGEDERGERVHVEAEDVCDCSSGRSSSWRSCPKTQKPVWGS